MLFLLITLLGIFSSNQSNKNQSPKLNQLLKRSPKSPLSLFLTDNGELQAMKQSLNKWNLSLTFPPHTPEYNGFSRRRHHQDVGTGVIVLHNASMALTFWPHAFETTVLSH